MHKLHSLLETCLPNRPHARLYKRELKDYLDDDTDLNRSEIYLPFEKTSFEDVKVSDTNIV